MEKHVIFFHGGASKKDYDADAKLVTSLQLKLGAGYSVHYPFLPEKGTPDLGRREQISHEISVSAEGVILVGHSLGSSMLLVCLSETVSSKSIAGIFLTATPFWEGEEDWVEPFKLRPDFAEKLDKKIPLFFYHCLDDDEISVSHFHKYKHHLPWASFREILTGGHQLGDDLSIVAADIKSI